MTQRLIDEVFVPAFGACDADQLHDGFVAELPGKRLAFSTDSFVVQPLFFKGGDIGKLAVCGTVNDLAMCGARPLWLSVGFILEEGFPLEQLKRIVNSMADTARQAGVTIVTGDTKVVERGKADGVYINTSGVGTVVAQQPFAPEQIQAGDCVFISGDVGRHGMAIMAEREGLSFEADIVSDCAALNLVVEKLIAAGLPLHCLRDCTRGGLATALIELAEQSHTRIELEEGAVPVTPTVKGACELLGFDPLYVANEGCFIGLLPAEQAAEAVSVFQAEGFKNAAIIGEVLPSQKQGELALKNELGLTRLLHRLSGEQLPRIC